TKARLRAIRSIGLRPAYTVEDLAKPFVVARLMWTGESDDPELRRTFAVMQAQRMLGGVQALYGQAPAPTPAPAQAGPVAPARMPPPPVGSSPLDDDDIVEMPTPATSEPAGEPARAPAQERTREPAPTRQAPHDDVPTVSFGKSQGMAITE